MASISAVAGGLWRGLSPAAGCRRWRWHWRRKVIACY